MLTTPLFGALAGVLSTLSPCVLPLIPIVLASAASEHRWGPAALAVGLAISFTAVGLSIATIGFAVGIDANLFRAIGGAMLAAIGLVLVMPSLQARVAVAAGSAGEWTQQRLSGLPTGGLGGQAGVGLLLGLVWAPCVGPTLGAASLLAARGENLGQVAATMLAFGLGAALPLLAIGSLSREAILCWRGRLITTGRAGKRLMGAILLLIGGLILTGLDKRAEAWLVEVSPDWLTRLTTAI